MARTAIFLRDDDPTTMVAVVQYSGDPRGGTVIDAVPAPVATDDGVTWAATWYPTSLDALERNGLALGEGDWGLAPGVVPVAAARHLRERVQGLLRWARRAEVAAGLLRLRRNDRTNARHCTRGYLRST